MPEPAYPIGFGRPPVHTRFQKGRSGNPGGKPGPEKLLKQQFGAALSEALNSEEDALREAKPTKAIESFARKLALQAVDGRPSAQRLVLSILDRESGDGAPDREMTDEPGARIGEREDSREFLGDRYDEYKRRFDAAVTNESVDELLAVVREFQDLSKNPASGNS